MIEYFIILDLGDLLYLAKLVCKNLHGPSNQAFSFHKEVCQSPKVTYSKFQYLFNLLLYEHIQITKDGTLLYLISFCGKTDLCRDSHNYNVFKYFTINPCLCYQFYVEKRLYQERGNMCNWNTSGENSSVLTLVKSQRQISQCFLQQYYSFLAICFQAIH